MKVAMAHHSVLIHNRYTDNIKTLNGIRRASRRPPELYIVYMLSKSARRTVFNACNQCVQ